MLTFSSSTALSSSIRHSPLNVHLSEITVLEKKTKFLQLVVNYYILIRFEVHSSAQGHSTEQFSAIYIVFDEKLFFLLAISE
jgi:hypothetical protein